MSMKRARLWPLTILLATSGCATGSTGRVVPVSEYCRIAAPIGYDSTADSAATVAAIEAHNSAWVCLCEGDCPQAAARSAQ